MSKPTVIASPAAVGPSRRAALGGIAAALSPLSALSCSAQVPAAGEKAAPATPETATTYPTPIKRDYRVLEVGPGQSFKTLTDAGVVMNQAWTSASPDRLARAGFRVVIHPGPEGYYTNDSGSHSRRWGELRGWPAYEGQLLGPTIIEGAPGKPPPVLDTDGYGDGVLYYQTGLFATGSFDATFRRLIFRGFKRRDGWGNYAAIRLGQTSGNAPMQGVVTLEDCEISGCDNGLMGGEKGQKVVLRRCYIHDNGNESGRVHNIYIGYVDELWVEDLLSTRTRIGHLLKSRAAKTTIRKTRLIGDGGTESACLDVPNAGVLDIDGLVAEKSPGSDAEWLIHYSGENQDGANMPFHDPSSVRIRNLTMIAPEKRTRRIRQSERRRRGGVGQGQPPDQAPGEQRPCLQSSRGPGRSPVRDARRQTSARHVFAGAPLAGSDPADQCCGGLGAMTRGLRRRYAPTIVRPIAYALRDRGPGCPDRAKPRPGAESRRDHRDPAVGRSIDAAGLPESALAA